MMLRMLVVLSAGLLLAADTPPDAATIKEVQQALDALNDAFTKQDLVKIKALTTEDQVAITPYFGHVSRAEHLKLIPELKYAEYKAGNMAFRALSKDVVLVNYSLTQKGTFKGNLIPTKNYVTSTWVRRDGKWLEAAYQETALP